jgi:hypothetical protein
MNISPLPPALEIARLQRMKEAFLGGESRKRFESMIAEEDWLAELNARLEHLQAISGSPTLREP